ncbi:hypothetical protein [Pseudomonas sp.]|uniref:hypothetical protein n=1 Tax=Pseudomonas sp. TaxID=306 RepID=UPI003FD877A7
MIAPPTTHLTPWRPGHWITQTGYALTPADLRVGSKNPDGCRKQLEALDTVERFLTKMVKA